MSTRVRASGYAVPLVLGAFVIGSMVFLPITAIFLFSAVTLSPLKVFGVGLVGIALSGLTGYCAGRLLGEPLVHSLFGRASDRVRGLLSSNAIISVAVIRNVPVAPYTAVNIVLGSLAIPPAHFVIGNILGLAPGLLVLSVFSLQFQRMLENPQPLHFVLMLLLTGVFLGAALLVQRRFRKKAAALEHAQENPPCCAPDTFRLSKTGMAETSAGPLDDGRTGFRKERRRYQG